MKVKNTYNIYTGDAALHDTPKKWTKDRVEAYIERTDALLKELVI